MMPYSARISPKPTPIAELRQPHPEQKRIDTESAALLRATALEVFRRVEGSPGGAPTAATASRLIG